MIGVIVVVLALAILVLIVLTRRKLRPHTVAEVPSDQVTLGPELDQFISAFHTASDETSPQYQAAVARLRDHAAAVIEEAERHYRQTSAGDFALRRSLITAVAAMRDPAAVSFLSEVALRPPPPVAVDPHMVIEAEMETTLSLIALEGLEHLAPTTPQAVETLVAAVNVPSLAVRAVALAALRESGGMAAFERAARALPADQSHFRNIRRVKAHEVPQIADPRRHLRQPPRPTVMAPALTDNPNAARGVPTGRAPTAGRR